MEPRGSRPMPVAVERVRDARLEVRLPTPPMLELALYGTALVGGILLGAAATFVAHGVG